MTGKPIIKWRTDRLVGVFGGWRWSAGSPGQAAHYGPPRRGDIGVRRQSMSDIAGRLLPRHGPVSDRCRNNSDLGGRTTTDEINTLDRTGGVEHEGPRHRGQRKVEPDVHEDCQEQCSATFNAPDLNPNVAGAPRRPRIPNGRNLAVPCGLLTQRAPATAHRRVDSRRLDESSTGVRGLHEDCKTAHCTAPDVLEARPVRAKGVREAGRYKRISG
jgi:hypothetical protein